MGNKISKTVEKPSATLFYYDEHNTKLPISESQLASEFKRVIGELEILESILWISLYRVPILNIKFIIIDTWKWHYSIETIDETVVIRRSKSLINVREFSMHDGNLIARSDTIPGAKSSLVVKAKGKDNMEDLMLFMYEKDHLNQRTHLLSKYSQHLPILIFNNFNSEGICVRDPASDPDFHS